MSKLVLKGMEERKRGAIVNIASVSGTAPMSLLTVYSATKVYVDYFSQALHHEYKGKGIFVQSVVPHFVASKMSKMRPCGARFSTGFCTRGCHWFTRLLA